MEKNGRIFIFGGGVKGKELLDYLIEIGREGDVEAFIDNDIKKQKDACKKYSFLLYLVGWVVYPLMKF